MSALGRCCRKPFSPDARVEAYEPLAVHHEDFRKATGKLEGIFLHPCALGSSVGKSRIKVTSFSDASSILPLTEAGKSQWNLNCVDEIAIEIAMIDQLVATGEVPQPDLIKLDVQGFELEVLKGAAKCLPDVTAVIAEVSFSEFYENQCLFHDVVTYLGANGFALHALGHSTPTGKPLVQADALFTRIASSQTIG